MSCHVAEGDAEVVAFLIHLGLALTDIEHAAGSSTAHAAEEEHHDKDKQEDGEDVEEHVHHVATLLVFEGDVPIQLPLFLCLVEEGFKVFDRPVLHLYAGVLACLLYIGIEHLLDELWVDIHLEYVLVVVDYHLLGSTFHHQRPEIEVVVGFGNATFAIGLASCVGEE